MKLFSISVLALNFISAHAIITTEKTKYSVENKDYIIKSYTQPITTDNLIETHVWRVKTLQTQAVKYFILITKSNEFCKYENWNATDARWTVNSKHVFAHAKDRAEQFLKNREKAWLELKRVYKYQQSHQQELLALKINEI